MAASLAYLGESVSGTLTPVLKNCEKWHFFQKIRGCYKGVSVLSILVSVGVFQCECIFTCSGGAWWPGG